MKKNYILVYSIDDFHELGGGTYVEFAETKQSLEDIINKEILKNDKASIVFAGEISRELLIMPIEKVTKYEIAN